jgi:RNA polymerase sigma-70 factor (ECF subfamily)
MSEPRTLVEHFFRHEFGRLTAVLTRSLGLKRLDLAEDVVQSALLQALQTWSRRGVPEDPGGWLFRTARNLAIDALRREKTHAGALPRLAAAAPSDASTPEPVFTDEIGDEPLRLLFVCCHESVPAESRVALALRSVCGFSTGEIARSLLTSEVNVQKRVERAKERLRELAVSFDPPPAPQLRDRLDAVLSVVYLLFNEGCHASHADAPIRRELCDEARRLALMLAKHPVGDVPSVYALVALLHFHMARFDARVSASGDSILLDEQDRSAWSWRDIRSGMHWMAKSAAGETLSRYHLEAAVAWEHCRAPTFADTDWKRIVQLYSALERVAPSPMHTLNRAIAEAYVDGPRAGLARLAEVPADDVPARYPHWHEVIGELLYRAADYPAAERAWCEALRWTAARNDQDLLRRRLAECRSRLGPGLSSQCI